MMAKAGEKAKTSGKFECEECGETFFLEEGDQIPECACGGEMFIEYGSEQPAKKDKRKSA